MLKNIKLLLNKCPVFILRIKDFPLDVFKGRHFIFNNKTFLSVDVVNSITYWVKTSWNSDSLHRLDKPKTPCSPQESELSILQKGRLQQESLVPFGIHVDGEYSAAVEEGRETSLFHYVGGQHSLRGVDFSFYLL